uniref:Uncharacterized protein n=1 Tax=Nelumbo nucifera TaxID=4432 RepID=A0A822YQQ9_NELNU|nr:TPA_asm: hypothetical protein HUJ06_005562 [Nelumbo nucifera]
MRIRCFDILNLGLKGDQLSSGKISDYGSLERRQYSEQTAYMGQELQSQPSRQYADSIGLGSHHQAGNEDRQDDAQVKPEDLDDKKHEAGESEGEIEN